VKRFTETDKWKDPWFRRLDGRLKLLWFWLCDQCDNAGIIDPDMELAAFQIGVAVSELDLLSFEGRIKQIANGKWMLTKFIPFQYGDLSEACPAHKPVFRSLESNRVLNGYSKGINTLQDKDKDKDKEKDTEKDRAGGSEKPRRKGTREELIAYAEQLGQPTSDGDTLFDKWEGNGWTNDGKPIQCWKATMRTWKKIGVLPSQRIANTKPNGPAPTALTSRLLNK